MITDIPTHNDFRNQGIAFLNLAWEAVARKVHAWNEIQDEDSIPISETEYWGSVHRELLVATALAQQAAELLLKARLAKISPFILISNSTQNWPSGDHVSFSDFRTIDAQDLPRAHDTVCTAPLPPAFHATFARLRTLRNKIFHTVARDLEVTAVDTVVAILEISHYLVGPQKWWAIRRDWDDEGPPVGNVDYVKGVQTIEGLAMVALLPPKTVQDLLGFDKKQRRYICLQCSLSVSDFHAPLHSALLIPNLPDSREVQCFVCDAKYSVTRTACDRKDCKGNVRLSEDNLCLTCYE